MKLIRDMIRRRRSDRVCQNMLDNIMSGAALYCQLAMVNFDFRYTTPEVADSIIKRKRKYYRIYTKLFSYYQQLSK